MTYYDRPIQDSMIRIRFSKSLQRNQSSKKISPRIIYPLIRDWFSSYGFDPICSDEDVEFLFDSVSKNELDGVFMFCAVDETMGEVNMTKIWDVVEECFLEILTVEAGYTTCVASMSEWEFLASKAGTVNKPFVYTSWNANPSFRSLIRYLNESSRQGLISFSNSKSYRLEKSSCILLSSLRSSFSNARKWSSSPRDLNRPQVLYQTDTPAPISVIWDACS